ncbi:hypothetical protein RHEC894_PC00204 (plasmid) [Rhizobium sp. CIAT894]|uniref:Uncharacterized protein n=1 Tax=Rhizobium etli (strain CIAT 652) TaxID=491916 RepID=B3Q2G2_RHIE6|nr:hypothetical protein RHECIAT_PB0000155 [Rhizobium etli CIAT 652]ARM91237.1 hypothetical protein RHEC894_PC00204 [Rhizobium sp. CIAT894]
MRPVVRTSASPRPSMLKITRLCRLTTSSGRSSLSIAMAEAIVRRGRTRTMSRANESSCVASREALMTAGRRMIYLELAKNIALINLR